MLHRSWILLAALALASCGDPKPQRSPANAAVPPPTDRIGNSLGSVNGMPIGSKEFDVAASRKMGKDKELDVSGRMAVMDELVAEKLLYQEAVARGIDKDPKIQKMIVNALLKEAVYSRITGEDIADDELRRYYDANKADFVVAERVQVKRILVKAKEGEDAKALRQRADDVRAKVLAQPDNFRAIAQEHSQDAYARRGGDLGYLTEKGKPGVDPAVVTEAFKLKAGEVSPIFATDDGLNILLVPNRHERVERSFDQMKGTVLRKVKGERYKTLYNEYVLSLRGGAAISVDEEKVKSHSIEYVRPAGGVGVPKVDLPDAEGPPPGVRNDGSEPEMPEDGPPPAEPGAPAQP